MKKFSYSIICPCGFSVLIKDTFVKAFGLGLRHEKLCKQINFMVRIK